jgi:hypothetical protein
VLPTSCLLHFNSASVVTVAGLNFNHKYVQLSIPKHMRVGGIRKKDLADDHALYDCHPSQAASDHRAHAPSVFHAVLGLRSMCTPKSR